jgi:RNAse (barnase) inhibitor barstar
VSVADWVDLARELPGLRGRRLHVTESGREERIASVLRMTGFDIRVLDGYRIRDEPSFFDEAERGLRLPTHFGRNWDALNDCLGDWHDGDERRIAIFWRDADRSLARDAQTVFRAVLAFDAAALSPAASAAEGVAPLQLEVFLFGDVPGFRALG